MSGTRRGLLLIAPLVAGLVLGCASLQPTETEPPTLVLVAVDGFRWDFRERGETPNLDRLVEAGVSAGKLIPVFPTKTFPNHYSIATGLYAEHHGLVANNIYDPASGATFALGNREEVQNGRWYGGEPIWVTAQSQGLLTAPVFWPGSEAEIGGYRPTYWEPYDGSIPNEARVDKVLDLLELPAEQRPSFLTLYFDIIDQTAHDVGPEPSQRLTEAVEAVDSLVGRLMSGLDNRGLNETVHVMVVSDHGMSQNSRDRVILLETLVDVEVANPVDWDPVLGLWPAADSIDEVYDALKDAHPHLQVFRRDEVPARLHYSNHPRIPPIIGIADDGWAISTREWFDKCSACFTGGNHGFDPQLDSMGAFFVAAGPLLENDVRIPELENVHLYNLMCALLGLEPATNDGVFAAIETLLAED